MSDHFIGFKWQGLIVTLAHGFSGDFTETSQRIYREAVKHEMIAIYTLKYQPEVEMRNQRSFSTFGGIPLLELLTSATSELPRVAIRWHPMIFLFLSLFLPSSDPPRIQMS